jgi:hypothetical protein
MFATCGRLVVWSPSYANVYCDATVAKRWRLWGSKTFWKKASTYFANRLEAFETAWLMCVNAKRKQVFKHGATKMTNDNNQTNEKILGDTFRTQDPQQQAQENRGTEMHIGRVHLVTDLADGQRAYPEPDHSYQVQSEDDPSLDTTVEYVERRGDRLIARGHNGQYYAVSGFDRFELKKIRNWLRR